MTEKVVLGRTGLKVTRLGFGGIPIQRVPERQAVETLVHAFELGVDFVDTSRAYTNSEGRIGMALKESGKKAVVATKSLELAADPVLRDVDASLAELGRERIDLYQCHCVKDLAAYRRVTSPGGALEGLLRAREEGLIGHIGISSHSLAVLEQAIADGLFETIMVCYSFLEPKSGESVIPRALASGMGVIVMKAFSGGAIEDARLALNYALALPGAVIIPGMERKEIVDENWRIFQGEGSLDEAQRRRIARIRARFDRQFCRRCDYCQPCPEGIQIQTMMGVRYLVKRMGPEALQGPWVQGALEAARFCTGCGACLERCPYGLPIPDLIRKNVAWIEAQLSEKR
jgi:predicted aldo/keto reductase-like oxidoreductase